MTGNTGRVGVHAAGMYEQHRIHATLNGPAGIAGVRALLSAEEFPSRRSLGRRLCEMFGFRDALGRLQEAGCVKALRGLESAGHVLLPEPRNGSGGGAPRRLGTTVPDPVGVPDL